MTSHNRSALQRRLHAVGGGQEVRSVKLDANETTACVSGGDWGGARSAEEIEDNAVRFAERE